MRNALPAACADKAGDSFTVCEYGPGDRAALDEFYLGFEPKRAAQGLPPIGSDRIGRWLGAVLASGIHLIVERAGQLIGHAMLIPAAPPGTAEYAIFLDKAVRGRGIGTLVNRLAANAAREAGFTRLWLSVEPHNRAALRSYHKAGFRFRPATMFSAEAEMQLVL